MEARDDASLEALEARYRETGDPGDQAALLRARLRAGLLREGALQLAARLGSPGAQLAWLNARCEDPLPLLHELDAHQRIVEEAVADQEFALAALHREAREEIVSSWDDKVPLPWPCEDWIRELAEAAPPAAQRIGLALGRWWWRSRSSSRPTRALETLATRTRARGPYGSLAQSQEAVAVLERLIEALPRLAPAAEVYEALAEELLPWLLEPAAEAPA